MKRKIILVLVDTSLITSVAFAKGRSWNGSDQFLRLGDWRGDERRRRLPRGKN